MPNYPQWNPAATPMSQVSDNPDVWEATLTIPDGAAVQYKYTRGSWDKVESWGAITGFNNRNVTVSYGADGTQLVDDTAVDWGNGADTHKAVRYWRDPIVVDYGPAAGAVDVPLTGVVTATWSLTMTENWNQGTAVFQLTGPQGVVSGTFAYTTTTQMATFTPNAPLTANAVYTVTISSQTTNGVANGDNGAQQTSLVWTFTTFAYRLYYPLIFK